MESVLCTEQKLVSKMSIVNTANAKGPLSNKTTYAHSCFHRIFYLINSNQDFLHQNFETQRKTLKIRHIFFNLSSKYSISSNKCRASNRGKCRTNGTQIKISAPF